MTDIDLTPRTPDTASPRGFRWRNQLIVGALILVGAVVLYQALTSARVFFYNVDEAVARQGELADRTFRMQGTVADEPTEAGDGSMVFTMSYGGVDAEVRHIGAEPSDLFRVGERVVAEGRWADGDTFESSQLLVKHSEQYVEDNPDRVGMDPAYTDADSADDSADTASSGAGSDTSEGR